MLKFLFKKELQLENLIYSYLENLGKIQELIRISMESCDMMVKQIDAMLRKNEGVRALMSTIGQNESHCDHIEQRIMTKLFTSELDPFMKLQLKGIVIVMGEISDQADRVSKRVNIMTLKRRV